MLCGEFLKVIFSVSLFCIYVLHIRPLSAIPWSRMSPDGRYNRKKFQLRKCISYGQSIIDGYRKGDPNIRVKIPTHILEPQRKVERSESFPSGIQGANSLVQSSGNNIASPSLFLPPLDPTTVRPDKSLFHINRWYFLR